MPIYFRSWKRKLGVVVLLMACMFMTGWVRSSHVEDKIEFPLGSGKFVVIRSTPDGITLADRSPLLDAGSMQVVVPALSCTILKEWISIPYWSVVLPLTALSAYLLLSRLWPLKSGPTQREDSAQEY